MRIARSLLVSLTTLAVIGCSTATEQSIVSQFFAASRLRDTTALKNMATVVFEPRTQGIITSFEITNVVSHWKDGELVSKDVSISAPVKLPNGQTAQKNLIVTMQRAVLKGDKDITGRWIITAIRDASGSASTPRS